MAKQTPPIPVPVSSFLGMHRLPDVQQHWGIKYATLADAFARGAPTSSYSPVTAVTIPGDGDESATVHPVPLPVADPKGCDIEQTLIQHTLPHPEYKLSATDCLTLNVSAPSSAVRDRIAAGPGPYPVVAFVHGGGFATGSANWPQWHLARLVQASVTAGTPVVAVGINYRLGPFGFLTSPALRDAGYLPNNGLHDQKLALRWIQSFIRDFGGDPQRVTYLGSSMGAASGFFHLQSEEPLFHQFVALAGTPLLRPAPRAVGDSAYRAATKALEIDTLSPAEQVKALLRIPAEELGARLGAIHVRIPAVVDGDIIPGALSYAALADPESMRRLFPGLKWCKAVWLSDSRLDGMILAVTALASRTDNLPETLKKAVSKSLGSLPHSTAEAVFSAYHLDDDDNNPAAPSAPSGPLVTFLTDMQFSRPAHACANAFSTTAASSSSATTKTAMRVYRSHFDVPNPWPGAWQGVATHALDLVFALQNYNDFLPAGQRAVAERMGRDVVAFAYGGEPFPPYREGERATMVYYAGEGEDFKDESGCVSSSVVGGEEGGEEGGGEPGPRGTLRRAGLEKTEVLDGLLDAMEMFLSGASAV